jgi:two-component system cell cycle sensor histidine kinase/response regulator CckA
MDASDYQKIRQLFDDYLRMYSTRDDRLTTYFSEDFSGFTGGGDFLVKDREEWVAITRQDFAQIKDPIHIELKDLAIQSLADTIAVATGFFTIHLPIVDHVLSRETARLVLIFHKESGGWKISHSSISIPYGLVHEGEVYPLKDLVVRNQFLEELIAERTIQLSEANDNLRQTNEELSRKIAEHKLAKEALKESENKFKNIAEQALVGIFMQQDGFFEYVNPKFAEIFGYTVEECVGRLAFQKLVHPDDLPLVEDEVKKRLSGQDPVGHYQFRGVTKKNELVNIELYGTTTFYNNKSASVGTLLDITERKRAEEERLMLTEQVRQAQKMEAIGTLAGGIAHDFNNILTTIVGNASLMQMKMEENSPFRSRVEHILTAADRATDLTKSLLTYSRKQISTTVPVELNGIVRGIDELLRRLMPENIEFKTFSSGEDLIIRADIGQIEQVLMNLVTNAGDALPAGGNLTISTGMIEIDEAFVTTHSYGKPGRYAMLSVADSGTGMDEKTRERIFEPFFSTKEPGKGTGLGLSIVHGIVTQHDGFIDVKSEPGQGTTFNIYLPLVDSIVQQTCLKDMRPPVGGTETILLIEDDIMVRQLIKDVLNCNGYNVIEAEDGEDGVGKYKLYRDEIQLILTDVMMPKKNGKEAYDEIRQITGGIKAIFMSGYSAATTKKILAEGLDYLAKPVTPRVLLAKIREVLNT